jgi:Tfp pilus assembly protein PilV
MSITNPARDLRRICCRRGFTLIEGLIATVILAFSVVSVSAMLSAAHQQSDLLESRSRASNLALSLLEEIRARPFDPPNALSNGFANGNSTRSTYDDLTDYQGYTATVQVPVPGTDGKTDPWRCRSH